MECVGCAYRGNYDLTVHNINKNNFIKKNPRKIEKWSLKLKSIELEKEYPDSYREISKSFFMKYEKLVFDRLEAIDFLKSKIDVNLIKFVEAKKFIEVEYDYIVPHVIEPSIGIDRMFFSMAVNLIKGRTKDPKRVVFKLPLNIAPYDLAVYALSNNDKLVNYVKNEIKFDDDINLNIFHDFSGASIGKKYTRSDGIGIRLTITVDFQTLSDNTVTLRFTDSGEQIRIFAGNKTLLTKKIKEYLK